MSAPEPPCGVCEEFMCKNRLQEFTQRASIPLPIYHTFNEGAQHAPHFRSRVWVDGTWFLSPNIFSNRKMAEQDAAKHALTGVLEKVKVEGCSRIREDIVLCKSIINEYALKKDLRTPIYVTNESKEWQPIFVASLELNGITYIGDAGRNKKEAEQFAARSAITSILDSEPGTTMSEIVKSKFKFYDALKKVKHSSSIQASTVAADETPLDNSLVLFSKRKEVEVGGGSVRDHVPGILQSSLAPFPVIQLALSESTSEQPSHTQSTHQSLHVFKKPKPDISSAAVAPPIVFVPPASEQASENPLVCSASGKKRNRKNKKAKKKVLYQSLSTIIAVPQSQVPACSVTQ